MAQQQNELTLKEKFNIVVLILVVFQRCVTVVVRNKWGPQALGKECLFAFCVIFAWAAFTTDSLMYLWLIMWSVFYVKRRMEAMRAFKNGEDIHSWSDGMPINLGRDIRMAKGWYEPICTVILGTMGYWYYQQTGMPVRGLPYFLFWCAICMRGVQTLKIKTDERREMTVNDARIEGEYEVSRNRWQG